MCLGYLGDEILPSYVGIILKKQHSNDPYWPQPVFHGSSLQAEFFCRGSIENWPIPLPLPAGGSDRERAKKLLWMSRDGSQAEWLGSG